MSDAARSARAAPHPLLIFLAILVAVLAMLSFAVGRIPIDAFRSRIETAFDRATGRQLTIGGPIRLTLLPVPGLIADDVSVANLPGGSRPVMAHVRRLAAHVALIPLLEGDVRVVGLTLTDPDILLERLPDGTPNWNFTPRRAVATTPGTPASPRPHRFGFTVDTLDGTGGTLTWRDRGGLGTGEVSLITFHAGAHDRNHPFTLYATGRHGAAPFTLSLASASLASLPTGTRARTTGTDTGALARGAPAAFPVRANLAIGAGDQAAHFAIDGRFADPLALRGFEGWLHATVPSLAALNGLLPNADLPAASDLALNGRLGLGPRGHEVVEQVALSGSAVDLSRFRPGLTLARFAIGAASLQSPVTIDVAGALGADPFAIDAPKAGTLALWQQGAVGTAPLDVDAISGRDRVTLAGTVRRDAGPGIVGAIDGTLALAAPDPDRLARLALHPIGWHRPVTLAGRLTVGRSATGALALAVDATSWSLDGVVMPPMHGDGARSEDGIVTARVTLSPGDAKPVLVWTEDTRRRPSPISIAVDGAGLPASAVAVALLGRSGIDGRLDVTARLTGTATGASPDPGSLSGPISATLEHATLAASLARLWLGPVLDAIHLPALRVGSRTVRCASVVGRFDAGTLHASALSLDDASLVVNGSGRFDFASRTLDLSLLPVLRLGGIGASTAVSLAGPFGDPHATVAPDAAGRYTLSIGHVGPTAAAACDASPDLGPPPQTKTPRGIDILRGLGLFR